MIVNQFNFNPDDPINFEKCIGESMTQPDLSLPLRTLLERYRRGQGVPLRQDAVYNNGHEIPDFDRMSEMEIRDLAEELRMDIAEANKELEEVIAEQQRRELEKEIEEAKKRNEEEIEVVEATEV